MIWTRRRVLRHSAVARQIEMRPVIVEVEADEECSGARFERTSCGGFKEEESEEEEEEAEVVVEEKRKSRKWKKRRT